MGMLDEWIGATKYHNVRADGGRWRTGKNLIYQQRPFIGFQQYRTTKETVSRKFKIIYTQILQNYDLTAPAYTALRDREALFPVNSLLRLDENFIYDIVC